MKPTKSKMKKGKAKPKEKPNEKLNFIKCAYAVVKFIEERNKLFETIPEFWFVDEEQTTCFWPPKGGRSATLRAIDQDSPDWDWEVYECTVVSSGHETYSIAASIVREKCSQRYNTSSADDHIEAAKFKRAHPGLVDKETRSLETVFEKKKKEIEKPNPEQNTPQRKLNDINNGTLPMECGSLNADDKNTGHNIRNSTRSRSRSCRRSGTVSTLRSRSRSSRRSGHSSIRSSRRSGSRYSRPSNRTSTRSSSRSCRRSSTVSRSRSSRRSGHSSIRSSHRSGSRYSRPSNRTSTRSRSRSCRRSSTVSTRRSRRSSRRSGHSSIRSSHRSGSQYSHRSNGISIRSISYRSGSHSPRHSGNGSRRRRHSSRNSSRSNENASASSVTRPHSSPRSRKSDTNQRIQSNSKTTLSSRPDLPMEKHGSNRQSVQTSLSFRASTVPHLPPDELLQGKENTNENNLRNTECVNEMKKLINKIERRINENDRRLSRVEVTVNKTLVLVGDLINSLDARLSIGHASKSKESRLPAGYRLPKLPVKTRDELYILKRDLKNKNFFSFLVNDQKQYCTPSRATDNVIMTAFLKRFIAVSVRADIVLKDLRGKAGKTLYHDFREVYDFIIEVFKAGYEVRNQIRTNTEAQSVLRVVWARSKQMLNEEKNRKK